MRSVCVKCGAETTAADGSCNAIIRYNSRGLPEYCMSRERKDKDEDPGGEVVPLSPGHHWDER